MQSWTRLHGGLVRYGRLASWASARDRRGVRGVAVRGVQTEGSMGWTYETVDPVTGQTPLDTLYESHLRRIHDVLARPLPPLPRDGNVEPDGLVGFAYYNYRRRDEYRALLARELQVPVAAVRLSVAWSGRFDVSRFNRVQKVCGVHLDRALVGEGPADGGAEAPLPASLAQRLTDLIRAINARRTEHLLQAQLVQASEAVPEVEFALSRVAHQLRSHLRRWIYRSVLQRHLVVVIDGGRFLPPTGATTDVSTPRSAYEALRRGLREGATQRRLIEEQWMRPFQSRQVVPHVLSLGALASLVGHAVQRGEVWEGAASPTEAAATLPPPVRALLEAKAGEPPVVADLFGDEAILQTWTAAEQVAACQWLQTVGEALALPTGGDPNEAAEGSASSPDGVSSGPLRLPALFVHGGYAGGTETMRYLQHNKAAMDVLLLRPNDVAFKTTFLRRLRNGHTRLRLHEEFSSPRAGG